MYIPSNIDNFFVFSSVHHSCKWKDEKVLYYERVRTYKRKKEKLTHKKIQLNAKSKKILGRDQIKWTPQPTYRSIAPIVHYIVHETTYMSWWVCLKTFHSFCLRIILFCLVQWHDSSLIHKTSRHYYSFMELCSIIFRNNNPTLKAIYF